MLFMIAAVVKKFVDLYDAIIIIANTNEDYKDYKQII